MSQKQLIISIFLLGILSIGGVLSQRIEIPLKKGLNDSIYFTVKYGQYKCETNVIPNLDYCSNIINQKQHIPSQCGSEYIGDNSFTDGWDYKGPFQLGDTQAELTFSVPTDQSYLKTSQLCFGYKVSEEERNALTELFEEQKIAQPIAFFSLNKNSVSSSNNASVGSLNLGEADQSLVKQGTQFSYLLANSQDSTFSAGSSRDVSIFGQHISSEPIVFIDVNSPFTVLDSFGYKDLLNIFTKKGIAYTKVFDKFNSPLIFLKSINKLEPLIITLLKEDNTPFQVSLSPSQYTKLQADGTYQLLIKVIYYTDCITIGNTILEDYVLGFDLGRKQILIAEKQQSSNSNNFRGSVSI